MNKIANKIIEAAKVGYDDNEVIDSMVLLWLLPIISFKKYVSKQQISQ